MLTIYLRVRLWLLAASERSLGRQRGQATAEYALVLLGAALVALLLVAWATAGGGAGRIGRLLDRVLDTITSRVG
jgi:hypothetical protein